MAKKLSDLAEVMLGFKSFLNDFFYVDQERIDHFGIEKEYLTPLLRVAELRTDTYWQSVSPSTWLFNCRLEPNDLRGTGAGKYVNWGKKQESPARKQSKQAVGWPDTPSLSHQKHWYWPAAPLHPARIAVRKGSGQRYAPFLFKKPVVLDQRLYVLFPKGSVDEDLLAAYLASSFFALSIETGADMGLGAGVLTFGAGSLRATPALDLTAITGTAKKNILDAANVLFSTSPPDADSHATTPEIRALDEALLAALGEDTKYAAAAEDDLARLAYVRKNIAAMRKVAKAKATAADVGSVAEGVAAELIGWLSVRRFPEDYLGDGAKETVDLPTNVVVTIDLLLDTCGVSITDGDTTYFESSFHPAVGEVVLRALQMGRRRFSFPTDGTDAGAALDGLSAFLDEFEDEFERRMGGLSLGPKYRDVVLRIVLQRTNMPLEELRTGFTTGRFEFD